MLALVYAFAIGAPAATAALLVGLSALSFAVSDIRRTVNELGWLIAGLVVVFPLVPAIAPAFAHLVFHAKLASLAAPYPTLGAAASLILHDEARLMTGHGLDAVVRGVEAGWSAGARRRASSSSRFGTNWESSAPSPRRPRSGSAFARSGEWRRGSPPIIAAALACDITFGFLSEDSTR